MKPFLRARRLVGSLPVVASVVAGVTAPTLYGREVHSPVALASAIAAADTDNASQTSPSAGTGSSALATIDTLIGKSRKLLFSLVRPDRALGIPVLQRLFGDSATRSPGVYSWTDVSRNFSFITMLPFSAKRAGTIGSYRIGFWPGEQGQVRSAAYANPDGFIRVTPENQDTRVSEHFRLRDFLTHDQQNVWPKYLVLRVQLVDKLELVIQDLERHGTPVRRMVVMSGFRTPQYNETGGDPSGRADLSRHQYGDAADVFVDNDGDGRMDDLNHDGRVNALDAKVIEAAAERVESTHSEFVGGVGLYPATAVHGPFAHIDVRGYRARWGHA